MRTLIHRLSLVTLLLVATTVATTVLTACGNKNELYYADQLPEAEATVPPQVLQKDNKTQKDKP